MVVADNIDAAKQGYKDLLDYLNDTANGFKLTTLPYSGGLLLAIYTGRKSV